MGTGSTEVEDELRRRRAGAGGALRAAQNWPPQWWRWRGGGGLELDDDTWDRARGWALWKALVVRAGISGTTAVEQRHTERVLRELLG